jgi:hypothetical protein
VEYGGVLTLVCHWKTDVPEVRHSGDNHVRRFDVVGEGAVEGTPPRKMDGTTGPWEIEAAATSANHPVIIITNWALVLSN